MCLRGEGGGDCLGFACPHPPRPRLLVLRLRLGVGGAGEGTVQGVQLRG